MRTLADLWPDRKLDRREFIERYHFGHQPRHGLCGPDSAGSRSLPRSPIELPIKMFHDTLSRSGYHLARDSYVIMKILRFKTRIFQITEGDDPCIRTSARIALMPTAL
jgi:hypothetical protein